MMISLITAWIAAICVIFTAFKYFAKKNKTMNRFFRSVHIPMGVLLIAAGLVHGLLAGNPLGTALRQASVGEVLFTWNMGTVCFILSILLGITYILRKVLKKNWMRLHRVFTVMLAACLVLHISQVGISIPYAIFDSGKGMQGSENIGQAETGDLETGDLIEETDATDTVEETESKALIEEAESKSVIEETETAAEIEETETDPSNNQITFSGAVLKDGTYEGTADGYKSTITVSVVVRKGSVADISIEEENETPQYFERAKEMISSILNGQSLEVDGISGATYSSKGIQNAVYNALQSAVVSGELKISDIQIMGGHGKGKFHK